MITQMSSLPTPSIRTEKFIRRSLGLERMLIEKLYQLIGRPSIEIALWDGTLIGDHQSPAGRVTIHQPRS